MVWKPLSSFSLGGVLFAVLALGLAALADSFITFGAALARPSLVQAVRALDGKYLNVPDLHPVDHSLRIDAGGTDAPKAPAEISQGDVTAQVSYIKTPGDGDMGPSPLVTVLADGAQVAQITNEGTGSAFPFIVQIAEIDPDNNTPEVVVSFYTGGAHCCSETKVATKVKGHWKVVKVGEFDGGPLAATDLNDDGHYEFETTDPAFLYAFGCYACSISPLRILTVEGGKVKNVSAAPRFRKAQESWMKRIVKAARNDDPNAYLAGYVAEKALLGEGKSAWKLMLAHYNKHDKWGLSECPKPRLPGGKCPVPEITLTYPKALARTLKENGYKL